MSANEDSDRVASWMGEGRCWQLLGSTRVSRVAFVDDGRPQIVVLNHAVNQPEVIFQTSADTRLAGLTENGAEVPVTIEVDSSSSSLHSGWSIVASGRMTRTSEADVDHHPQPWRSDAVGVLLRLTVDEIHGQLVGA